MTMWREGRPAQRYVRVLLVDDDEDDALIARELLDDAEHVRFAVAWERDAEHAIARLAAEPFDVCLLDLRLGPASGLDVLAAVRDRGAELPVVMLTGQDDRETDLRAMEAGATEYLVKGRLDARLLERTLRYAIESHHQREEVRRHARELEAARAAQQETNEHLAEMVRRQNELLGMVVHDLRTPLGVVIGFAELLLEHDENVPHAKVRGVVERIRRSARFMLSGVDDLLDLAAIESGTLSLRLRPCDLGDIAARVIGAMQPIAAQKGLSLRLLRAAAPAPALGDDRRLEQVVQNLVGNAIKYSHAGGEVQVRTEPTLAGARLVVEDRGIGIEPELRGRLFAPLSRSRRAGTSGEKSFGLGLAIVRRIVDAHGGTIGVESEPGAGTRFVVELPS